MTTKNNRVLIGLAFVVCLTIFFYFRWANENEVKRAKSTIESLLRNESLVANSYALSKSIVDLETLGLITCAIIFESHNHKTPFYDSTEKPSCKRSLTFRYLIETEFTLRAINGNSYLLRIQFPFYWQSVLLEVMSYLMIAALTFIYSRHTEAQELEQAVLQATVAQSRQVSHDIRSPLAALNMSIGSLEALPEDKRQIIRGATQRINDIANQLLQKGTSPTDIEVKTLNDPIMLASALDSILSEKRMQYRDKQSINIRGEIKNGYGLFTFIETSELARVVSNIINNSIEAVGENGNVAVQLESEEKFNKIVIQDDGKGIPPNILARLGERGFTYGKEKSESGSGLGVYHAREAVNRFEGLLQIESEIGKGTIVTISLPKAKAPWWFVNQLKIVPGQTIVSLDDDQTIHQIWEDRTKSSLPSEITTRFLSFSSSASMEAWLHQNKNNETLFLIDYQFLGTEVNGLDIIEKLGIAKQSVLVTSRFDEPHVRERAKSLGVKILPKGLAPFVPFSVSKPQEKYSAIVIDDDLLVHKMWALAAKAGGHKVICFERPEDFFSRSTEFSPDSPLFIDVDLGNGARGEAVAEKAAEIGFTQISLATGHAAHSIKAPACVKRIVGKEPIFS